jgi:hypothetical protein
MKKIKLPLLLLFVFFVLCITYYTRSESIKANELIINKMNKELPSTIKEK